MTQKKLSIIIVNYNSGQLVERCMASIYKEISTDFELIFIDNNSADGSGEIIKECYPDITFIQESSNLGLAKAFNDGLEKSSGEFLLSLDSDTVILPEAIEKLITEIEQDKSIGGIGSRLIYPDGTIQHTARRFPNPLNALFGRRSLLTKLWPDNHFSKKYLMTNEEGSDQPYEVDSLSTACFMVRREVYESVGGLDPDYFVYWVDTDWCYRIKDVHWKIIAIPDSVIIHDENIGNGRRERRRTRMIIDFHKGAYRFYRKNIVKSNFNLIIPILFFGLFFRAILMIIKDEYEYHFSS